LVIAALTLGTQTAWAQHKVALLIGNAHYQAVPVLRNPPNDVAAIGNMLIAAGFEVDKRLDLDQRGMLSALRDFSDKATDAEIGLIFFSGHGLEIAGQNYLVPVDARLKTDRDVEDEAITLDRMLRAMAGVKGLQLVILDACRDNPFVSTMQRRDATRSIGRGLARVEPSTGNTLIAFAAKAGTTAADGDDAVSPFTAALVKHLGTPGVDVEFALRKVRDLVLEQTRQRQEPFFYGSLGGDVIAITPPLPVDPTPKPQVESRSLEALKNSGFQLVVAHRQVNAIISAAYSPDGSRVAAAGWDKIVKVWDIKTGELLRQFSGHSGAVQALAFSPNGHFLLSGGADLVARLWDLESGQEIRQFAGHTGPVTAVAFSPDGAKIVTGSSDATARLWDAAKGVTIGVFGGHGYEVRSVAFSPDGQRVLTGSGDTTVRLWNVSDQRQLWSANHDGWVNEALFSPDGTAVVTGSSDRSVRIWDARSGRPLHRFSQNAEIRSLAVSPNGRQILIGGWDRTARLIDAQSGHELRAFAGADKAIRAAEFSPGWVNAVAFSPDGQTILTASAPTLKVWNVARGDVLLTLVSVGASGSMVLDLNGDPLRVSGEEDKLYQFARGPEVLLPSELRRTGYRLPTPEGGAEPNSR
jgi:WD40 repeat protein